MKSAFLGPLIRHPQEAHAIVNQRSGRPVAMQVKTAFDSKSRRGGLLSYSSMPEGLAMVIAPSNAIHTFFMRFPIDVAFVTRDGRVVKICSSVKPWRMAASFRAYAVVELPAGTLARCETMVGDFLVAVEAPVI